MSTPALSRAEAGARHRLGSLAVAVGFAVLACVWLGPLPELAASTFTAHMTMHVAVVCVAAPILASGLAGTRYDRVDMHPLLFSPLTASLAELVVVWGWHTPVLHAVAREHEFGLMTEQASFLLVGLMMWLSVLGGPSAGRSGRAGIGLLGLLLTSMHMTLLGALLTLAPRPLYGHVASHALDDQRLGGLMMLMGGGTVYLLGALFLASRLLRSSERTGR